MGEKKKNWDFFLKISLSQNLPTIYLPKDFSKTKFRNVCFNEIKNKIIYIYRLYSTTLNIYIYIYMVPSISSQIIFVQVFKIAIDSWKFSMLLLYILWDDWPIFMISDSNQQLQQQLEYTLLKPDCHSWGISKMLSDTLDEQYAIKFCLNLEKISQKRMECFRLLLENLAWVFEWHKRFKEGRESVRDDERCGRSKEVNTPEVIGQRVSVRVTMLRF